MGEGHGHGGGVGGVQLLFLLVVDLLFISSYYVVPMDVVDNRVAFAEYRTNVNSIHGSYNILFVWYSNETWNHGYFRPGWRDTRAFLLRGIYSYLGIHLGIIKGL